MLLQLTGDPTSQWVSFRKIRERYIEAWSEDVRGGAGLSYHRLSQPGAGSWVQTKDQMVPAPIPVRRQGPARSSMVLAGEEEVEASFCWAKCIESGAFQGVQDPAMSLSGWSSRSVHKDLEEISLTFGGVEAGSPGAAAPPRGLTKLQGIFWECLRLEETPEKGSIQPAGPAWGAPWKRPGWHCQAKREESQEDEEEPED